MPLVAAHNLEYTAFIFTLLERSLQLHNFIASFMLSLPQVKKKTKQTVFKMERTVSKSPDPLSNYFLLSQHFLSVCLSRPHHGFHSTAD